MYFPWAYFSNVQCNRHVHCCIIGDFWMSVMLVIQCMILFRGQRRYDQIILDEERSLIQKWDDEKRMQKMAERGMLHATLQKFIRKSFIWQC